MLEKSCPVAKSRKFLVRKELKVVLGADSRSREWVLWVLASAVKDIRIVVWCRYIPFSPVFTHSES